MLLPVPDTKVAKNLVGGPLQATSLR